LEWKINKWYTFEACVCTLRYPACNAHEPYFHLWPVRLYCPNPRYLINGKIFERKKLLKIKCIFWLSLLLRLKYFPF
jgi:hypothetical protein